MVTKVRTLEFLPDIFRTTPNQQFLTATLDQLVQQPNITRMQGYIGRQFEYGINSNDSYITEPTKARTNYQLEPAVVFTKEQTSTASDFITYPEMLDSLKLEGGPVAKNSSLFSNQFYSWDSFTDLDKLINFNQYYWLPNGPDPVEVRPSILDYLVDYNVSQDITNAFTFTADNEVVEGLNPTLTLLRGGKYTFSTKQFGNFWIQTIPGITGTDPNRPNISTRSIFGVTANGAQNNETITFQVPAVDAQNSDVYPGNNRVDLVATVPFDKIHGKRLSEVQNIDGITILNNKSLMFYGFPSATVGNITRLYDDELFDGDINTIVSFDEVDQTDVTTKFYRIVYNDGTNPGDPVIILSEIGSIPTNEKITVSYGTLFSTTDFVKNPYGVISIIPTVTAPISTLYYQDGTNPSKFGIIKLIEGQTNNFIDLDSEVLGKKTYVSPNGVTFTNGLKVTFSGNIFPASYQTGQYYVEGVGSSITLHSVLDYVVPEKFTQQVYSAYDIDPYDTSNFGSTVNVPVLKDYITVSRNANSKNAWSRSNRWFHVGVLTEVVKHNSTASVLAVLNSDASRAKRPIIEFYPNIKLFDSGTVGKGKVSFIDTTSTDAFNQVSGTTSYFPDGSQFQLTEGSTIIFANDKNLSVRNKIYSVNFVSITGSSAPVISLAKTVNGDVTFDDQVVIFEGDQNKGKSFYFDGSNWKEAQQKINVNQPPLFDIFDQNGLSLSDTDYYQSSDFLGCTLFEYAIGTGSDDIVLGFPLKYNTVNNIGDIGFSVSLNANTFNYVVNNQSVTEKVSIGYPHLFNNRTDFSRQLGWQTAAGESFQYQAFDFSYNPASLNNAEFLCDVPAKASGSTNWQPIRVIVNSTVLAQSQYIAVVTDSATTITLNTNPTTDTQIQILIYSDVASTSGAYYTIPSNLANNPFNTQISTLNLGDVRGHYQSICVNSNQIQGTIFGPNNFRDLGNLVPFGNKIIQSSAPLPLMGAFLRNKNYNLIDSLTYSGDEYVKFKTLLLDTINKTSYDVLQSNASILDDALNQIAAYKSESNSFFWSDMLPNRSAQTSNTYRYNSAASNVFYSLSKIYDFTSANYDSVLVYLIRTVQGVTRTIQLVRGKDYIVSSTDPKVTIFASLQLGDHIVINEYNQTYGSFVPNTPTKLGFLPAAVPEIVLETNYLSPTYFIKGHDGSLTKLYGSYNEGFLEDFRDRALFEFELRIYNNIKVDAALPVLADDVFPGQFRTTSYSYSDIMGLYSIFFLNWVGKNRVEYKPQYYLTDNQYTWNYNQTASKLDTTNFKQGNWKGIYRWYYDTVTPDSTPWEMIGYVSKPLWWETRYGEAPYTSDNLLLWNDMELGFDYNGGDSRILPHKARPGLLNVLPVDSEGKLAGPMNAVVGSYDSVSFSRDWKVGDCGPAEYSYLKSSTWAFDLVKILALCKPAKFFALGQNLDTYKFNAEFNQYLVNDRYRLSTVSSVDYGSGKAQHSYLNWIVDYVQSTGATGTDKLNSLLSNLDVRLTYRLAGFSDKDLLNFYVERSYSDRTSTSTNNTKSLMVPNESYSVLLHENQPFSNIQYSGVIVQKTENGFKVYGNSQNKIYFTTFSPLINGNYRNITVSDLTVFVSKNFTKTEIIVPYGTEFNSAQALAEFIANYGRYLTEQGIKFENIENNIVIDWNQIISEVLYWIQSGWEVGAVINVNPIAKQLVIDKESSIVQPLTIQNQNYILNQDLIPIQLKDMAINRDGTIFTAAPLNDGDAISYFTVNLSNIEHAIVFDNTTIFNDLLFDPSTGLRQNRMMVKGRKTAEWTGTLDTQGFILNQDNIQEWAVNTKYTKGIIVKFKNDYWLANSIIQPSDSFQQQYWVKTPYEKIQKGLLPNASSRAYEASLFYDSTLSNLDSDSDILSFSLIGYRPRNYLASANISEISQVGFYKSFIAEKGSKNSLTSVEGITLSTGALQFTAYENWAIRTGQYGGVLNQNFIEFKLDEKQLRGNPNIVGIVDDSTPAGLMQVVPLYSLTNYNQPIANTDILPVRSNSELIQLPTAGYVNFNDVAMNAFTFMGLNDTSAPISELYKNEYVWVADHKGTWNVYTPVPVTFSKSPVQAVRVNNNLNSTVTVLFDNPHGLVSDDLIMILNFGSTVDGLYEVLNVNGNNSVVISLSLPASIQTTNGTGIVAKFESQRVATPKDIESLALLDSEFVKNKVWVDNGVNGDWAVYRKSINYKHLDGLTKPESTLTFGSSMVYDKRQGYFVGDAEAGVVYQYSHFNNRFALDNTFVKSAGFGAAMAKSNSTLVITQPQNGRDSNNIAVASIIRVYSLVSTSKIQTVALQQEITFASKLVGNAITLSGDSKWMFVSATASNEVLVYSRNYNPTLVATELYTDVNIAAGDNSFVIAGENAATFTPGTNVSFSNMLTGKTYLVVTSKYESSTDRTTIYLDSAIATDVTSGTAVYTATFEFVLTKTLTVSNLASNDKFGYSLSTNYDGSKLFVGTPEKDFSSTYTNTGFVYMFDRTCQIFEHSYNTLVGQSTVFTLAWQPATTLTVTLNGVELQSSQFTLTDIVKLSIKVQVNAGDIVKVSSSDFINTQTLSGYTESATPRVGIKFGNSIDNNTSANEFIVGAPFDISESNIEGSVYRYTNGGKKYGIIIGETAVNLTAAATILINGYAVTLPAGTVNGAVTAINNANVTNVKASATTDSKLIIQLINLDLSPINDKLSINVFDKTVLVDLGIVEYKLTQILHDINQQNATQFGYTVKYNEHNSFVVSAPVGIRYTSTSFDFTDDEVYTNDTIFDNNFTVWVDNFDNAGAVYMFDYLPAYNESLTNTGKFVLAQTINDTISQIGPRPYYGETLAFSDYTVVVGSPTYYSGTVNGSVTAYQNAENQPNWSIYRTSEQVVDINKLQSIQLFDNTTNEKLDSLDYIDPLQGKLFGVVRENLDFISNIDPAGYNTEIRNNKIVWAENFVGKLWFDTTYTRFVDYHQNDVVYNSEYWANVFPGSTVAIYTWIESDVMPMNYAGTGTPYDLDAYTTAFDLDNTGAVVTRYYYWVRNTDTIVDKKEKTLTDSVIASYISNPQGSGISFFAPFSPNVFGLYNCNEFINSTTTSVHVGFKSGNNDDTVHNQFQLIRDGFAGDFLTGFPTSVNTITDPQDLYLKMLESLSGVDNQGQVLPNPYLPSQLRTGVLKRPNQSFFIDRLSALENYCNYANRVLLQYPITEIKNPSFLNLGVTATAGAGAPIMFTTSGEYFDTNDYWEYVYWYAAGFSNNTRTDLEVPKYYDLVKLNAVENMVVGVLSNSDGKREIYKYTSGEWIRVGLQQGTIQIKSSLWDYSLVNRGFGSEFFDTMMFDNYPSTETMYIIRGLNEEVFTGDLLVHRNKSLILLFEYITGESTESQNYLPWLNKTSFMNVQHTMRELTDTTLYQSDDEVFLEGYLNEVKPYHVIIKEFSLRYTRTEVYNSNVTDFDLPAMFNAKLERFTTPELTFVSTAGDDQFLPLDDIWSTNINYATWFENYGLALTGSIASEITRVKSYVYLTSNQIEVNNAFGFPISGTIRIDQEIIGYSNVDRDNGILFGLSRGLQDSPVSDHAENSIIYMDLPGAIVLNSGRDYIDPPVITAYIDTAIYPAPRTVAKLRPIMLAGQVIGVTVINPGSGYAITPELIVAPSVAVEFADTDINYIEYTITAELGKIKTGDLVKFTANGSGILGLVSGKYYYAAVKGSSSALKKDYISLHVSKTDALAKSHAIVMIQGAVSTGNSLNVTARLLPIASNAAVRQINTKLKFDRTSYYPKVTEWVSGEYYSSVLNTLHNDASSGEKLMEAIEFSNISGTAISPAIGTGASFNVNNLLLDGNWFIEPVIKTTGIGTGTQYAEGDKITDFTLEYEIQTVTNSVPARVTTKLENELVTGTMVNISGVVGMPQLATAGVLGTSNFYIKRETGDTFTLYSISDYSIPVDSLLFTNAFTQTGVVRFTVADCTATVTQVDSFGGILKVKYPDPDSGTPWETRWASLQGSVLPILTSSTETGSNNVVVDVNYFPSSIAAGNVKGRQLYFYKLPVTFTPTLGLGGAIIIVQTPRFDGTKMSKNYTIQLVDGGSIYSIGQKIIVPGTSLGGASPANDLIITVTYAEFGSILYYSLQGVAVNDFQQYYVYPISDTRLKLYKDPALKLPVTDTVNNPFVFERGDYAFLPEPIGSGPTYRFSTDSFTLYNNKIYRCTIANSDTVFDYAKWIEIFSDDPQINALDRVFSYYQPNVNMPGKNLPMLMDGLEYPNATYLGNSFNPELELPIDTVLKDNGFYPKDINLTGIIFDGYKYVAVGDSSENSVVLTSGDGVNWTFKKLSSQVLGVTDLAYSGSFYVVSTTNINTPMLVSYDAINWVSVGAFTPFDVDSFGSAGFDSTSVQSPNSSLQSMLYVNETFIGAGSDILSSNNAVEWTVAFNFDSRLSNVLRAVAYANNGFAGYIAVGNGESVISGADSPSPVIENVSRLLLSSDGVSWLPVAFTVADNLNTVFASPDLNVIAGNNGVIYYSANGRNWVEATVNGPVITSNLIHGIYARGQYVLIGDNGTILYSFDGRVWDQTVAITKENLNKVTYYGDEFIVVGEHATILKSKNATTWVDNSYIASEETAYAVKGDAFMFGYGPEELVAGVVNDCISMTIKSTPGSLWTPINGEHCGFNMIGTTIVPNYTNMFSFDGIVTTPTTIAVYAMDQTTHLGTRLMENVAYSVDWYSKTITLLSSLEGNTVIFLELYEIGGGNQTVRGSSDTFPMLVNARTGFSYFDTLYKYNASVSNPVVYVNGELLTYLTDYTLLPNSTGNTNITFNQAFDPATTYISFALMGSTIVNDVITQYGYSIPQTQVFTYSTGPTVFDLNEFFIGGTNSLHAIVELNGLRLIETTDYTIDSAAKSLTVTIELSAGDTINVTTFNDTREQFLVTDMSTTLSVTPIYYMDTSRSPAVIIVASDPGFITGDKLTIDGLVGASQLQNNSFYAKLEPSYEFEGTTFYPISLFLDETLINPVIGPSTENYVSGGFVWKAESTIQLTQPELDITDPTRLFVTVNGARVDTAFLRMNSGNYLNIMVPVTFGSTIVVTSMMPSATPEEMTYSMIVDKNGVSDVYRANTTTRTWLTKPLYTTQNSMVVKDASKLVTTLKLDAVAQLENNKIVVHIAYVITSIKQISIFNTSTLSELSASDSVLITSDSATLLVLSSNVSEGDLLALTIRFGDTVMINGEKIRFADIDYKTNTLSRLTRGVDGTAVHRTHLANLTVSSLSPINKLPAFYYDKTWNSENFLITGDPLQISDTFPAEFLKS